MTCGIYLITNIINNHSYIGQSVDIETCMGYIWRYKDNG